MATYTSNAQLKNDILNRARMNVGGSQWMDHFLALTIDVNLETGKGPSFQIEIGARLWETATKELSVDERLALLTLVSGKKIVSYDIYARPDHETDRDTRFGGQHHGAEF